MKHGVVEHHGVRGAISRGRINRKGDRTYFVNRDMHIRWRTVIANSDRRPVLDPAPSGSNGPTIM